MSSILPIQRALISVYHKEGLEPVLRFLHEHQVKIYSTGGTQHFIEKLNIPVNSIEDLTGYPPILGGRVKTLHPKVFGGILGRKDNHEDVQTLEQYDIPFFDLVVVDLYPFEQTVASTRDEQAIIEKIDIGGVSLIRAAAKNFYHTLICCNTADYESLLTILKNKNCGSDIADRRLFAVKAFATTSNYDVAIFNHFNNQVQEPALRLSVNDHTPLRYGENPHQKALFYGNLNNHFQQLHGKELSYNNILDIEAATGLINEFKNQTIAIIKHTNVCGIAEDENQTTCWAKALAGDPVSAFGGIICCNRVISESTAKQIDEIFFEVIIAPGFEEQALEILKKKKNRIILQWNPDRNDQMMIRSALNGYLVQERDNALSTTESLQCVTQRKPTPEEISEMLFAEKVCKHLKSNTIVLTRNKQLLGMGCGQTSRVDALKQAIQKAKQFGFNLIGSVMASDAFFPFPDCVEIAHIEGIELVIQPGGSIKDKDSTEYCDKHFMCMVHTGIRHFKH